MQLCSFLGLYGSAQCMPIGGGRVCPCLGACRISNIAPCKGRTTLHVCDNVLYSLVSGAAEVSKFQIC